MSRTHVAEGWYPYFPLSDRVIYVTKGLWAEWDDAGLHLDEWLETLPLLEGVTLDEAYEIRNPHTGEMERWQEKGRARCVSSEGKPSWFSYMPRHISAIVDKKLPSVRMMGRFEKVLDAVGKHPSMAAWCQYVRENRYLRLQESVTKDGQVLEMPGRAVTVAKSGGVIVFRPSAVFISFSHSPYEATIPDPVFLATARKIGGLLGAEVVTSGFP